MGSKYWPVIASGIIYGSVIFGGQVFVNLGLSLYEISLFPMLLSSLLLSFILLKKKYRITRSMVAFFVAFGLIGAVAQLSQFGALVQDVPVAVVVFLLYTQPFWTILLSKIFLHEDIIRSRVVVLFLVLVGVIVIINPFQEIAVKSFSGMMLAIGSGISFSAWIVYGRKGGMKEYPSLVTTFGFSTFATFFLILFYPIIYLFVHTPSVTRLSYTLPMLTWIYLLIFTCSSYIIATTLFFHGVQKVSASDAGMILLVEPISGALFASIFLNQQLTLNILLGGALILISNYATVRENKERSAIRKAFIT